MEEIFYKRFQLEPNDSDKGKSVKDFQDYVCVRFYYETQSKHHGYYMEIEFIRTGSNQNHDYYEVPFRKRDTVLLKSVKHKSAKTERELYQKIVMNLHYYLHFAVKGKGFKISEGDNWMTYEELTSVFKMHEESEPDEHLTAHIVFTEGSFGKPFSKESRTYIVSSNNDGFKYGLGYNVYGSCLDGMDSNVRLDTYIGNHNLDSVHKKWVVDYCYLVD